MAGMFKKMLKKAHNVIVGDKPTTKKERKNSPFNARAAADKLKENRKRKDDQLKAMFPGL